MALNYHLLIDGKWIEFIHPDNHKFAKKKAFDKGWWAANDDRLDECSGAELLADMMKWETKGNDEVPAKTVVYYKKDMEKMFSSNFFFFIKRLSPDARIDEMKEWYDEAYAEWKEKIK